MRISVVINTLNRAQSLRTTLEALRFQTHSEIEVVVVNGPSTDETEDVLLGYRGDIKHLRCPEPNLSMSRNVGIRAAAGDVVAFVDDDAIPEYDWLSELASAFVDPEVAAAGGVVFDHTGMGFQTRFAIADRLGHTVPSAWHPDGRALCAPGAWSYPSLMGTNTAFRRRELVGIGGFDEVFEYYLDETDVLVRLVDAGWVVELVDGAPVHHHFLPSHIRNEHKVVRNWYPVIKNRVYFGLRHARDHMSEDDIFANAVKWANERLGESAVAESAGALPRGATRQARRDVEQGIADGRALGCDTASPRLPLTPDRVEDFVRYPRKEVCTEGRMVLVTGDYPPRSIAGVSRFMSDVAPSVLELGCEVRVFTRAMGAPFVAWEDGVWVHRLRTDARGLASGTFDHIDGFASAVVEELNRISRLLPIASVYGAAWDVETLGAVRMTDVPVGIMLVTPARVAAEHAGWLADPHRAPLVERLFELEHELFGSADLVHGISHSIVENVRDLYGGGGDVFDPARVEVFPLGLRDRATCRPGGAEREHVVTFVGRLEYRKGIDVFLEAVLEIASDFPDVRFVVAGSDPYEATSQSIADTWRRRQRGRPALGQVEFRGEVSDDELHELYRSSQIVVMPSRFESFGLVVVEAFMHGAAVITSDVGGIPEFAESGVCAQLIAPGDATALAVHLRQLLGSAEDCRRLGAAARAKYDTSLRIERAAQSLIQMQSRLRRIPGPSRVVLDVGETFSIATDCTGLVGLTFTTASSGVVAVDDGHGAVDYTVNAPGRRVQVHTMSDDGPLRIVLREGTLTFVGATGAVVAARAEV